MGLEIMKNIPENSGTIEEAYKFIGFGKANLKIIFYAGLILMTVMNECTGISIILPVAHCDLHLTESHKGYLNSLGFFGILVPSLLWGYIADTKGRRITIVYTLLLAFLCSIISVFSYNFWVFVIARFFTCFFISGPSTIVYAWVGEFNSELNRSTIIQWSSAFFGLSYALVPALGWLILPYTWSLALPFGYVLLPWRVLLLIYALPGVLAAIGVYMVPETPKFLSSQNKDAELLAAVKWLWTENTGKLDSSFPFKHLVQDEVERIDVVKVNGVREFFKSIITQIIPIFQRPYVWKYLVCCFIMLSVYSTSGGLAMWFPDMVNRLSNNDVGKRDTICNLLEIKPVIKTSMELCDAKVSSKMFIGTIVIGSFYFVGALITALVMKFLGSGVIVAVCLFGSATAGVLLHFITEPYAVIVLFGLLLSLGGACLFMMSGVVVNIIPTKYRSMSVAILFMIGRMGGVVTSSIIGHIVYDGYCTNLFQGLVVAIFGFGKANLKIIFYAGLIIITMMNECNGISIILPAAHCDLHLSENQKGYLNSVGFLGISVPSLLWGYVADTKGRRITMLYTLLLTFLCSMISVFSYNLWVFMIARFFTCFFISGPSSIVFAWVGEFNSERNRSTIIQWSSCFFGLSYALIPALGWLILPYTWSLTLPFGYVLLPWRVLMLLYALPGLLATIGVYMVPETPKFLASQNKDTELLAAVKWLWTENTGKSESSFPFKHLVQDEVDRIDVVKVDGVREFFKSIITQIIPIFQRPYVWKYLVCCFIILSVYASSEGLGLWFPDMVNRLSINDVGKHDSICNLLETKSANKTIVDNMELCDAKVSPKMFSGTMMISSFDIVGAIITALLMKFLGSGFITAVCLFGAATAGALLLFITEPHMMVVLFGLFLALSGICMFVVSGVVVNLIPTKYRSMSVAILLMVGRTSTVVTSSIIGHIIYDGYCRNIFQSFVVVIFVSGLLNFFLPWKIKEADH